MSATPRSWICGAIVALAVVGGGAARLGTVGWGLPYQFHVDEKGFVVWEALYAEHRGLTEGDWRPRINTYGPLVFEIVIGVKWATAGGIDRAREVARDHRDGSSYLDGAFSHVEGEAPFHWPSLYRWLRIVSALLGTLAIALLARAAWRLEGPAAGAWTAVGTAACVALIQVGHFYTPEAILVGWIAMLLHSCARLCRGGGLGTAVYAGVALALIAATKMPGLVLVAVVPAAIGAADPFPVTSSRGRDVLRMLRRAAGALLTARFWVAVGVALLVYRLVAPWPFTEPELYFNAVAPNRRGFDVLRSQLETAEYGFYDWRFPYNGTTPAYWLTNVLPWGLGWPLLLTALASLLAGLRRLSPLDRLALLAAVPTLALVAPWNVKTIRYALPALPGLLLAAGTLLARWGSGAGGRSPRHRPVRAALAWGTGAWTLAYGLAFTLMFTSPDPRVQASRWVRKHAEPGDVVAVGPEPSYTAPLGTNDDRVGIAPGPAPEIRVRYLWRSRPRGHDAIARHLEQRLSEARFLVVGEFYLRRGLHPQAPERAPAQHAFYDALRRGDTGFEKIAVFCPDPILGPLRWSEKNAEILSIAFDHPGIVVYERRGAFRNPVVAQAPEQP